MGDRSVPTVLSTSIAAKYIKPYFAVSIEFPTADLNLWNGVGFVDINGKTYVGGDDLLSISDVDEDASLTMLGATVTLSGIPSEQLASVLTENWQGSPATIYLGETSDFDDNLTLMAGTLDKMDVDEGEETSSISVAIENEMVVMDKVKVVKYTESYQKSQFAGDTFFDYVDALQEQSLEWGG